MKVPSISEFPPSIVSFFASTPLTPTGRFVYKGARNFSKPSNSVKYRKVERGQGDQKGQYYH
jgi:hypothetical protein